MNWIGRAVLLAALIASPGLAAAEVTPAALSQAVVKLQALARQSIQNDTVPGIAVAVVQGDRLVYAAGFGVADVTTGRKVDADTVFQLASVSKPLASTVVAELVGEGKIAWASRISDLDPGFELADPWVTREVRIDDLFSHRAGLVEHAGDLLEDLGFSRAETLRRLRYGKPGGAFRASYAYTNFGLTEAAVAAARPYGLDWEDAAESCLFRPLGMASTSYRYADFTARADKALGHVKVSGRWVQKYHRDPDTEAPAGGASSSVNDLAKWMRLQLSGGTFEGRRIVNEAALAETHAPQARTGSNPITGAPQFYGLGWNVNHDPQGRLRLSHSGAFALGAGTMVYLVPSEHLGVVVLTNAAPVGAAEGLAFTFIDEALYGRQSQDWPALFTKVFADPASMGIVTGADYSKPPAAPSPAAPSGAYAATYANAYFGDVEVSEAGGRLSMALGPERTAFPLTHYDRDVFTYEPAGENAAGPSGVIFTLGPDGKATTMTVENLNIHGDGVFTRKLSALAE
ncbi:MAG TPA: serine hydrolase [Caulobacteraceae bacterium]|jgi:CubicO group peptidase (beta-lactamase class C family)